LSSNRLTVEGVAIGSVPVPYRLDYALATVAGFIATQVELSARGDGRQRSLTLTRLSSRGWVTTWPASRGPRAGSGHPPR